MGGFKLEAFVKDVEKNTINKTEWNIDNDNRVGNFKEMWLHCIYVIIVFLSYMAMDY